MKKQNGVGMDIMKLYVSMPYREETMNLVKVWKCRMGMPQVRKYTNVMNVRKSSPG